MMVCLYMMPYGETLSKEFEGFQTVYNISFNPEAKILVVNLSFGISPIFLQNQK